MMEAAAASRSAADARSRGESMAKRPIGGWEPPPPLRRRSVIDFQVLTIGEAMHRPIPNVRNARLNKNEPFGKGAGFCSPKKKKNSCEVGDLGDI
jgi:hypothetical protein